jgi:hypothetical protein
MAKKYKNYNVNANIEGNLKLQKTEANTDDSYKVLVVNNSTKEVETADVEGGGGDNFATADLTLTGDRLHDTDNNNLEFKNNDTKIVLKNIMLDGESVLFAGNIITHVDGSDTIIMYDGIVYKPDFESFMLQQITYNSSVLYSEKLYTEGQKYIYSPGKSFAIDGELKVSIGGVIFEEAEFLKPPNWTTLGRPVTPEISFMGYNTSDNKMEYWNGTTWIQF